MLPQGGGGGAGRVAAGVGGEAGVVGGGEVCGGAVVEGAVGVVAATVDVDGAGSEPLPEAKARSIAGRYRAITLMG